MKKIRRKIEWFKTEALENPGWLGLLAFLLVGGMIIGAAVSRAEITKQVNYQGKLTNASGVTVTDGNYDMVIRIYDASSGGNCLWSARGTCGSPTARTVTVENGIFSIMLGDTSAGDNALDMDFNSSYWLGVTVESDSEMTPRKPLGAAPYAFNADLLDGLDSAASGADEHILKTGSTGDIIGSANLHIAGDYAGFGSTVTTATVHLEVGTGRTDSGYAYIDLVGDTTYPDYGLRLLRGDSGANASSVLAHRGTGGFYIQALDAAPIHFQTSDTTRMTVAAATGNVGIGTMSPGNKLTVSNGSSFSPNNISTAPAIALFGNYGGGLAFTDTAESGIYTRDYGEAMSFYVGKGTTETAADNIRVTINGSGNVGIGILNPGSRLQVYENLDALGSSAPAANTSHQLVVQGGGDLGDTASIGFQMNGNPGESSGIVGAAIVGIDTGVSNTGELAFFTGPASTGISERLRIDSSGNIGMGTDSPSVKLDIVQSADNNGILLTGYDDVDSYTGALNINSYGNLVIDSNRYLDLYATNGIRLQDTFITNGHWISGDGGNEGLYVDVSGNVGIGSTSPQEEVDIGSRDKGNDTPGPSLRIGANTNAAVGIYGPAPGTLNLSGASGGSYYFWVDDGTGILRTNAGQAPTGSLETPTLIDYGGAIVGEQSSWYKLKDNIEAISEEDRVMALEAVINADMYHYTMYGRNFMGHVIYEEDRGSWFSYNDEHEQAIPSLNERNLFGYHGMAIQELNARQQAREAAISVNTSNEAIIANKQLNASIDGLTTKVVNGAITDNDFTANTNGTLAIDSANGRMYFRYNESWHYVNQTGGFQIPNYETAPEDELSKTAKKAKKEALDFEASSYDDYLTRKLVPGEFLIPYVDEYLEDGAVHGLYARFEDVKGRMFGQEREQLAELAQQSAEQAGQAELLEETMNENVALLGTNLEEVMEEVDQLAADQEERWDELDILLTKDETKLDEVALLATGNEERIETLEDQMSGVLERLDGMEQELAVVDDEKKEPAEEEDEDDEEEEKEPEEDGEEGVFWAFQSAAAALERVAELNDREASEEEIAAAGFFKEKTIAWPSFWNELELASSTHYGEVDLEELDEALEQGSAPILYLSLGNGQEGYYVVVREKDDENYQVDDPLRDESMELMDLREWLEGEAGKTAEMDQLIVYQPAAEKLAGGVGE